METALQLLSPRSEDRRDADRELVERARDDAQATAELFEIYYDRLFNYAMRRMMNVADAEDATAATFLKMVAHLPKFRWRGRPFSAWLYRILVNEITDRLRRRTSARVVSLDDENADRGSLIQYLSDPSPSQSENLARLEEFQKLHEAIAVLPPKNQDAVTLRYFEGLSLREIAFATKSNVGLVKWRLHQARKQLAVSLRHLRPTEE